MLVISAWVERENGRGLRSRITCRPDSEPHGQSSYEASIEAVLQRVRDWLELLMREAD